MYRYEEFNQSGGLQLREELEDVLGVITYRRYDGAGVIQEGPRPATAAEVAKHRAWARGRNADSMRAKIAAVITTLENADRDWDTLTTAQKLAAVRLSVRVSAKLGRLLLELLDSD